MVKDTEKNDKLYRAVVISFMLHMILMALLIYGSLQEHIISASRSDNDSSIIRATIVDPIAVVEQFNCKQKRKEKLDVETIDQNKAQEQATIPVKQKKATNKTTETNKFAMPLNVGKKNFETRQSADEYKHSETHKTKKQATQETAAAKKFAELNNLFNDLSDSKANPVWKGKQKEDSHTTQLSNTKAVADSSENINTYIGQIQNVIQSKFYDPIAFTGKTCNLRIKLAPNGLLINVQEVGGDPALCQAAVSAAKRAQIPKPPSDAIYQHFKFFTLTFKPQ
ncbi:Protein TolA [Serratia symbiotica]|nr:Protein TolA [Serratia symbiotica]